MIGFGCGLECKCPRKQRPASSQAARMVQSSVKWQYSGTPASHSDADHEEIDRAVYLVAANVLSVDALILHRDLGFYADYV